MSITHEDFREIREVYQKSKNPKLDPDKNFVKFVSDGKSNIISLFGDKGEEDLFAIWDSSNVRFEPQGLYKNSTSAKVICNYLTGVFNTYASNNGGLPVGQLQADLVVDDINQLFRKTATYLPKTVF